MLREKATDDGTFRHESQSSTSNPHCPKVSVIIPCYNHGQYLDEAVLSILGQTYRNYEIIVIDDGSLDENTVRTLENYNRPSTTLIRTSHHGLANARNVGITACTGKYILPLDADDKVGSTYLEKAVAVLEGNERVGIVYCNAEYFGGASGKWELKPYALPSILYGNVIFCSAFFRKSDWAMVNGYNRNMIYGWEDYDFWLSLIELGREVFCIPEPLFYYRKRSDSMVASMKPEHILHCYAQLFENHPKLYAENMGALLMKYHQLVHDNELQARQKDECIATLQGKVRERDKVVADLQSSLSWKLTKPLRHAKAVCRTVFGRYFSSRNV